MDEPELERYRRRRKASDWFHAGDDIVPGTAWWIEFLVVRGIGILLLVGILVWIGFHFS